MGERSTRRRVACPPLGRGGRLLRRELGELAPRRREVERAAAARVRDLARPAGRRLRAKVDAEQPLPRPAQQEVLEEDEERGRQLGAGVEQHDHLPYEEGVGAACVCASV